MALLNQSPSMVGSINIISNSFLGGMSKGNLDLSASASAWPQELSKQASESVTRFRVKSSHAFRKSHKHAATAAGSVQSRGNLMLNEESAYLNLNDQLDVNIDEDEVCVEDNFAVDESRLSRAR